MSVKRLFELVMGARIAQTAILAMAAGLPVAAWGQTGGRPDDARSVRTGSATPTPADADDPADEPTAPPDTGAPVRALFSDFLHFARVGKFAAANTYAKALLAHPKLDPVELARLADADREAMDTLLLIVKNSSIGESAVKIIDVIHAGEYAQRTDAVRIKQYIDKLGGDPQTEYNAIKYLAESGEHAVPWMLQALTDPAKQPLRPRIIRALPRIGNAAVIPLAIAMTNIRDTDLQMTMVRALERIEYASAIPYLSKLAAAEGTSPEVRSAAQEVVRKIMGSAGRPISDRPADQFFGLGEQFYDEAGSVRADPRNKVSIVWYWDESNQFLQFVQVPTGIFGPVMAMRACDEAMKFQPDHRDAQALWLAANIRREARLGMNVESGDPNEKGAEGDETRPENFPRSLYFTRASGPAYAHLVLQRAMKDRDGAVALGAIAALSSTAGPSSMVGTENERQPLVQALEFPDPVVRTQAAIALGRALPSSKFYGDQNVVPVLAKALALTGKNNVLVVDPDPDNLNRVMGILRGDNTTVIGEGNFLKALDRARKELDGVSAFFLATDMADPGLTSAVRALRDEFVFAGTPIVLLVKPKQERRAIDIVTSFKGVGHVDANADESRLQQRLGRVAADVGQTALNADVALELALESADTLRGIGLNGRTAFDLGAAESGLAGALASPSEELRISAASVLALLETASAQRAIAATALDDKNTESLRIAAFGSLADSAKRVGNKLADEQLKPLIDLAKDEPNLNLRTAASEALGALNVTSGQGSEIFLKYYRG